MMENSYYSVISPEGCAAILWKSGEKAPEAAERLLDDLVDQTQTHHVLAGQLERLGGAHRDNKAAIELVRAQLETWLVELKALPKEELMEQRYQKFRHMGAPVEV